MKTTTALTTTELKAKARKISQWYNGLIEEEDHLWTCAEMGFDCLLEAQSLSQWMAQLLSAYDALMVELDRRLFVQSIADGAVLYCAAM
jgi:hypothetical protein